MIPGGIEVNPLKFAKYLKRNLELGACICRFKSHTAELRAQIVIQLVSAANQMAYLRMP